MAKYCVEVRKTYVIEADNEEEAFSHYMNGPAYAYLPIHVHVDEPYLLEEENEDDTPETD